MPFYLDTSAFMKVVVSEPESGAMRDWIASGPACWSSQLLRTEAVRAARCLGVGTHIINEALEVVALITPGPATYLTAALLGALELRTLDALHLASALELGDDLQALVTYDSRMIDGAKIAGVPVLTPLP